MAPEKLNSDRLSVTILLNIGEHKRCQAANMWPDGINSKAAVDKAPPLYPFVPPAGQG